MKNESEPFDPSVYQESNWPDLQSMVERGSCPCCGERFNETMPMEVSPRCHTGAPVWVSYWDGMLFMRCATCDKPIFKIKISRDLLAGYRAEHKPTAKSK